MGRIRGYVKCSERVSFGPKDTSLQRRLALAGVEPQRAGRAATFEHAPIVRA